MTATTYRVDILTKDLGLLMPESTGLPEPIRNQSGVRRERVAN